MSVEEKKCIMLKKTVSEIANYLGGEVIGDGSKEIYQLKGIEDADQNSLSFVSNEKYVKFISSTDAGAILIQDRSLTELNANKTYLVVDSVDMALTQLLALVSSISSTQSGVISDRAVVADSANVDVGVSIEAMTIVGQRVFIGKNSCIGPQVYIADDVEIGEGCHIHAGVKIMSGCKLGNHVEIKSNAVIGGEGFGYKPDENGHYQKVHHVGNVIIEDFVSIGACATIDRAVMGSTIIGSGVKLDNLIHIAHNVKINKNTVIAAQTGVSGSTEIGANCMIGGQVGFIGHIRIEDGTQIQAQSGVLSNNGGNKKLFGSPAINYTAYLKSYALFKRLPELSKELSTLKKELKQLRKS